MNLLKISILFLIICSLTTSKLAESAIASSNIPIKQSVIYEVQTAPYSNFQAAIFAQGQMSEAKKLPPGSEIALYIDAYDINGPSGLSSSGKRCTSTQASASYNQDTITMDKKFCTDFNDAILDGKPVYGLVPTESVFLHKSSGERCTGSGGGGTQYTINPSSAFYRNYLVKRGAEKLSEFNTNIYFLDDLEPGWNNITSRCSGNPIEYASYTAYRTQMIALAQYVRNNMPGVKIEGNLASASSDWDQFQFLDGAMCENCFTNWGGSWPSTSEIISDLSAISKWIRSGHKTYIISQAPDNSQSSNKFTFSLALLVTQGDNIYHHFGADYNNYHPIPEYNYDLGLPLNNYSCNNNICSRLFERGLVEANLSTKTGTITLTSTNNSPQNKPGDFDGNNVVNLLDYNLIASKFGNPYTLLDYNLIASNFGN